MKSVIYSLLSLGIILSATGCQSQQHHEKSEKDTQAAHQKKETKSFTKAQRQQLKKDVLNISDQVAKKQGLAMSNRYLSNGSYTNSDFYGLTSDGEIQVIDNKKPGAKHFKIHNLVGVSMYTSNNKTKGYDEAAKQLSNIEGYQSVANMEQPIKKYLFADNGKVYYYAFQSDESVTLSSGFSYKDYNDKDPNLKPNVIFKETKNETLKKEWKKILDKSKD
ncbi:hypothetical protein [Staphylococcus succinus]|uniref:hypothetical protein n=1 Tax=Staphylococcus succinus TaxID=61015 RepID=UPI001C04858F|nr:hypothetical protein [Staphylococcus succinus]MBU0438698.1 hypothetical protein [Staphylococcus succinus]